MKRLAFGISLFLGAAAWCAPSTCIDARIKAEANRVNGRYAVGETAVVTFTAVGTNGLPLTEGKLRVSLDNFGRRKVSERTVDLSKENPFTVSTTKETPGFMRCTVGGVDGVTTRSNADWVKGPYVYGVGFDVEKIASGTPDPADFDAFWSQAIAACEREVPLDPRLERMPEKSTADVDYFRVSFATVQGRRVYGWMSRPGDLAKGPYPVRVSVPGAGIGALGVSVEKGAVHFLLNVHSYPQLEDGGEKNGGARKAKYDAQDREFAAPRGVKRYCQAGIHESREAYFYYATILGVNRAVNWLAAQPWCDRADFTYSGTSQGGGFGLVLTALNRNFTRSCIFVPALTDLLGFKVEDRQSGWPQIIEAQKPENRAAAERWAPYFCGVNFARRIHVPIRFVVGFSDNTCSPNAVFAAYNACPSADKAILDGLAMGHNVYGDFYAYLAAWQKCSKPKTARYRFLAFNIWGDFFGNPCAERDLGEVEVIGAWKPDVVGLQEATAGFWKSRLFGEMEKAGYAVVGRGLGPNGKDASDPVLYRRDAFELLDSGAEWFCPELDYSKGAVWAVLRDRANGKKIAVFASHYWWRYDGPGDDWIRKDNSRRLVERMRQVAAKHDAAIIGGGDLNAPMDSAAMKHLLGEGWRDAQCTAVVSPRGFPTEHGDPVRDLNGRYVGVNACRGINRCRPKFQYLDHVFYDPNRVTVERFDVDVSPKACSVSDHHPIIADFDVR